MRLLLTMNLPYWPSFGGAPNSNRFILESLVKRGHACTCVVPALHTPPRTSLDAWKRELEGQGIAVAEAGGVCSFRVNGVDVHAVVDASKLRPTLEARIAAEKPDCVLASTEDPSQTLLETALKAARRVVLLVRTTNFLPCGPQAFFPSERRTRLLGELDAVVSNSAFVADYVRTWSGVESPPIHLPVFGSAPFPDLGARDNPFVTMVNPSDLKGLPIFLGLARALPEVAFAAVPGWGTTPEHLAALRALPNVTLLDYDADFDRILRRTRVLVVPSLLAEAFPRSILEAMLRRIPVLASDVGGNREAKLGTRFVLPVEPITEYGGQLDDNLLPVANVPAQAIGPWVAALSELLDGDTYEREADASARAARAWVSGLSLDPLEELLERVVREERRVEAAPRLAEAKAEGSAAARPSEALDGITPAMIRKLAEARRARRQPVSVGAARGQGREAPSGNLRSTGSDPWIHRAGTRSPRARVLAFPRMGGSAAEFAAWGRRLTPGIELAAVEYPGHGTRIREGAVSDLDAMVGSVVRAARPLLDRPCVLVGHSMGAALAFLVARQLEDEGGSVAGVVLSGNNPAGGVPTLSTRMSDGEILADLAKDDARVETMMRDDDLVRTFMPSLRADLTLQEAFASGRAISRGRLRAPLWAAGGSDDPFAPPASLESWRACASGPFAVRVFPGGHDFVDRDEVVASLVSIVEALVPVGSVEAAHSGA